MSKKSGKQVVEKKNKWEKGKNLLVNVLMWAAKLACILLFLVILILVAKIILPFIPRIILPSELSTEMSLVEKVLTIGLTIIGLAISVWAGLNIVNSIERKELEELRTRTESVKQLIYNIDSIESIAYNAFLHALLRVGNDEATAYFYKEFSRGYINSKEDFFTLTQIEDLFGQVYSLHNTVNHSDLELIRKAEEAIEYIDSFHTKNFLVKTYLDYRRAEFNYYCGYVGETAMKQFKYFSSAIEQFLEVLPKMKITLPHYSEYKAGVLPDCPDNSDTKLTLYMANSLGDASSKILQLKDKIISDNIPSSERVSEETLLDYGKKALFYCGCAAKWADKYTYNDVYNHDLNYLEVYYRNYGVAYERYDKAFGKMCDHAEIIIENYSKAFYHIVKGTKIPAQRTQSVYHTLLSYLKRYFDNEFGFDGNNGLLSPFGGKDAWGAASQYKYKIEDTQVEYLRKMASISEIAMVDTPRSNIPAVMNGFAYTYVILLKLTNNSIIDKEFKEDYTFYLAKIKYAINVLSVLNIDDTYAKELKGRYEVIKAYLEQTKKI